MLKWLVAPFTGAWIETCLFLCGQTGLSVAPFTGAWIETALRSRCECRRVRRSLHGSVD